MDSAGLECRVQHPRAMTDRFLHVLVTGKIGVVSIASLGHWPGVCDVVSLVLERFGLFV